MSETKEGGRRGGGEGEGERVERRAGSCSVVVLQKKEGKGYKSGDRARTALAPAICHRPFPGPRSRVCDLLSYAFTSPHSTYAFPQPLQYGFRAVLEGRLPLI